MKIVHAAHIILAAILLSACSAKHPATKVSSPIIAPTVINPPDFSNLSTGSCKSGEIITTPAILSLNGTGDVTNVSGLNIKDKKLSEQITEEFKKAKYTPYLKDGQPIARPLKVAIRLICPKSA